VEAGFTPAEALRSATSLTAEMHLLQDRGVIAPGFRADLVLLNADPLVNISNTRQIVMVMVAGVEYSGLSNSL
jgi:imidazolonepropionase-like amidohydrolase